MDRASAAMPLGNPVLRYLAVLRAARDFGVDPADIAEVAARWPADTADPRNLADALADLLTERHPAA